MTAEPAEGVENGVARGNPQAVRAMIPQELLEPDEIIILLLKPSPWFILLASLRTLALVAVLMLAALVLAAYLPLGVSNREIVLLGLTLMGLRLFWQFLEWLSRVYALTDRRVLRIAGVLRVSIFEAPLPQIQHTTLFFSLRERLVGLGTIGFATAGTGRIEAHWVMIAHPRDIHRQIVHALRRYRR